MKSCGQTWYPIPSGMDCKMKIYSVVSPCFLNATMQLPLLTFTDSELLPNCLSQIKPLHMRIVKLCSLALSYSTDKNRASIKYPTHMNVDNWPCLWLSIKCTYSHTFNSPSIPDICSSLQVFLTLSSLHLSLKYTFILHLCFTQWFSSLTWCHIFFLFLSSLLTLIFPNCSLIAFSLLSFLF